MNQDQIMTRNALNGKFGELTTEKEINDMLNTLLQDDFFIETFLEEGKLHAENAGKIEKVKLYNNLLDQMSYKINAIPLNEEEIKISIHNNPAYREILQDYNQYKGV